MTKCGKISPPAPHAPIDRLSQTVCESETFGGAEASNRLIKIPTGDGMTLVFRNSSEKPAHCALEITGSRRAHPEVLVRMGIHSGLVSEVNEHTNIAGAGINIAQRVMDCGNAGHILLSPACGG